MKPVINHIHHGSFSICIVSPRKEYAKEAGNRRKPGVLLSIAGSWEMQNRLSGKADALSKLWIALAARPFCILR